MTNFKQVVKFLENKFGINIESEITANVMMLRIKGLDNVSLQRYINNEYKDIKVTCNEYEGYKFYNTWIKIERI